MSSRRDGGGGGGGGGRGDFFLSSHRCPEVDLLPHQKSKTPMPPPCSLVPEVTCRGQSEENYLEISDRRSEEEEEEEEEEGSLSDWSEEDLSLHFSPSVILPSDEEESDPESGFECVDVSVDTQVKGQEGAGLKMVPKRLIQLKKKKDAENLVHLEKVSLKEAPAEGGGANVDMSANELLCSTAQRRPDLLLRQNSVPASFHTRLTTSSDVDANRVYRGLVAGAGQGYQTGGNSAPRQRLQKSFSLDETKTKMASCIIKSVLSKKMQVEQNNAQTSHLQRKCGPQPTEQQTARPGGGGEDGSALRTAGVTKAPVHVVRDVRSLVKNSRSLSFCTAPPAPGNKTTSFKVIGQQDSPPPTYQQAVGVRGHNESKRSCPAPACTSKGHVTKVSASLSQSKDRGHRARASCPITQQRRASEPIISKTERCDVTFPVWLSDPPTKASVSTDPTALSKPDRGRDVSHQARTSVPLSVPPSVPPSQPEGTQLSLSAHEHSRFLGVSSLAGPTSTQQVIHPCFYTPSVLPTFPPPVHPHLGRINYLHGPLSYVRSQLQLPPVPTLHLLRRPGDGPLPGAFSVHPNNLSRSIPPQQPVTAGGQEGKGSTGSADTQQQEQQEQQEKQTLPQHLLCSAQGFLPAQVGNDFLVDITGSAGAPGGLFSGPAPCHMISDPKSGRYFYVEVPALPQRKMLLDPETGQYVQVFLPAAGSFPNSGVLPAHCVNSTPIAVNAAPASVNPGVLSVMQLQPTVAVPSMFTPPCLPFSLTPTVNVTHTAP